MGREFLSHLGQTFALRKARVHGKPPLPTLDAHWDHGPCCPCGDPTQSFSTEFWRTQSTARRSRRSRNHRSADSLVRAFLLQRWVRADKAVRAPIKRLGFPRRLRTCWAIGVQRPAELEVSVSSKTLR